MPRGAPLRGFQFARVALKEQRECVGLKADPSPGWARCAKRIGLAPLSLVLFCSLFKGKRKEGRGEKGEKKNAV